MKIARCSPIMVLLAGPFYLNDLANIYVTDWRWWLLIDYTLVKLLPFALVFWLVRRGGIPASDFGLVRQAAGPFLASFLILALAGTVIDQNGYRLLAEFPGYSALGSMPAITSPAWNWIDLTLGLAAVAAAEELVFRGCMLMFLQKLTSNRAVIVAVSAAAFGLIHWSIGLHAVLVTAVLGSILMLTYMNTRSLPAIMLAHFAINFVDFAGVVPKSVFQIA